jgi:hypothetical protein
VKSARHPRIRPPAHLATNVQQVRCEACMRCHNIHFGNLIVHIACVARFVHRLQRLHQLSAMPLEYRYALRLCCMRRFLWLSESSPINVCQRVGVGLACEGGSIIVREGFWLVPGTYDTVKCLPSMCERTELGGAQGCAPHRDQASLLCGRCEEKYSEWGGKCIGSCQVVVL